jgi:hypothetical protein
MIDAIVGAGMEEDFTAAVRALIASSFPEPTRFPFSTYRTIGSVTGAASFRRK